MGNWIDGIARLAAGGMSRREALRKIGIGLAAVGVAVVARPEVTEAQPQTCDERCTEECPDSTEGCVTECAACRRRCKKKKWGQKDRKRCIKKCLKATCPDPICDEDETCGPSQAECTCRRDVDGDLLCAHPINCGDCGTDDSCLPGTRCVPSDVPGAPGTCYADCDDGPVCL